MHKRHPDPSRDLHCLLIKIICQYSPSLTLTRVVNFSLPVRRGFLLSNVFPGRRELIQGIPDGPREGKHLSKG